MKAARIAGILMVLATAAPAAVAAQELSAEQAGKVTQTRQAVLKVVGWNIGPMSAMVRGLVPWDQDVFATRAQRIAWMTTMIPDAFRPDTSAFDLQTEALPVIWDEFDRFEELAANARASAHELAEVAAGDDVEASKAAFGALVDDCRACHDRFREKDD